MNSSFTRCGLVAMAGLLLSACEPDSPMDGGGVTYTKDVQPIFMAKCSPCHSDQTLGMHDLAKTYEDVLKPIHSVDSHGCWNDTDPTMNTMPKKVGECALILIMNGQMPLGAGCASPVPLEPSMCLSSEQKATLDTWIKAGMPR